MSLTDDWKAGKLPEKNFFIKTTQGILIGYHEDGVFYMSGNKFVLPTEIEEVLGSCDYDHFVELTEKVKELEGENEQMKNALEDIGYCKTWYYQNRPDMLVDWALEGLGRIGETPYKIRLAEEIEQLRGLLKECIPYINDSIDMQMSVGHSPELETYLLTRINEVLG